MKAIVVYYSLEGSTRLIAQNISQAINADIIELIPKKAFPDKGFSKFFWGGKSVVFKEKPELESYSINVNDYDLIILGTPIWAGKFTPPINTFLHQNDLSGKKTALFVCHSGGGIEKCYQELQKQYPNMNIIAKLDLLDPLKNNKDEKIQTAIQWATKLSE